MSELVRDVSELYEPVAEEAGFDLVLKVSEGLWVKGSRELLSHAMTNLLDNAFKYGLPEDGSEARIIISLTARGDRLLASVSDRGAGIPEESRQKVRERFARLEESRSKPGNGLGLALVEAIMKMHGGTLELEDANPGLIATLNLPKS